MTPDMKGPSVPSQNDSSFFSGLLDLSFSIFLTQKIVRFLYALSILAVGLSSLAYIRSQFREGFLDGLGAIVVTPIVALFVLTLSRMALETTIVLYRIGG